jgi:RNA polymerase sigma-70 factor (ECF subfamily)
MDSVVDRARAGDRAALEALLSSLAPSIHRFGMRMCKNAHDADDVLQDTLISVATHLGEFEGRSSLSSWVFALTRSACARRKRGLKNRPHLDEEHLSNEASSAPSPETSAADHELGAALTRALDALSPEHREVILLRDVEGLSASEAAGALEVSVDALKSRLHRAREALRRELRPLLEPRLPEVQAGCPDVAALWSKKLEGDLSQADCSKMEKHIETCAACNAACDTLRRALLACRRASTATVPPEVQARVKAAILALSTEPSLGEPRQAERR